MTTRLRTVLFAIFLCATPLGAQTKWVATWGAASAPQLFDDTQMNAAKLIFKDQTLRQIVHTSIGGDTIRVRLSNTHSLVTARIGAAHVARRTTVSELVAGSDRTLTFGGRSTVVIPAGAIIVSDPVRLDFPAGSDLVISLYFPESTWAAGVHYSSLQTNYIGAGDQTSAATFRRTTTVSSWAFLAGVDVLAAATANTIVTFGDSITDGTRTTADTNRRWPDYLAARFLAAGGPSVGIANMGISGNRILHDPYANVRFGNNALARFERDVLSQPGVKFVIVLLGINDIGQPGTGSGATYESVVAEDVIFGMQQMIDRAHEAGIKIYGATLTPFTEATSVGYFSAAKEAERKRVNQWIRTSGAFDAVIDFDLAVRDPAKPDQMLATYDSGDHLHPGDAGCKAMADAITLALFQ